MGCQSSKPSTSAFVHPGNRRQANKPYAPPASAFSNGQATSHFVSYGGGNALVLKQGNGAAQPQIGATAATMTAGGGSKYDKQPEYIQVTLPAGVTSGQTIQVAAPDGRLNEIIIPQGFGPGDTFTVEFSDAGTQPPPPPITANQAVPLPVPPRNNDYDDGFASGFGNNNSNNNNNNYAQATTRTSDYNTYYPTATDAQAVNTTNYASSQQQQPSTMNYATPY
mmetsp:Transcript_11386/g.12899  ORF Transcript_11386/g.12899 Transcript_11386/m.12899 type:complete len:223 (-) Transcript_11386:334-1002(-)